MLFVSADCLLWRPLPFLIFTLPERPPAAPHLVIIVVCKFVYTGHLPFHMIKWASGSAADLPFSDADTDTDRDTDENRK